MCGMVWRIEGGLIGGVRNCATYDKSDISIDIYGKDYGIRMRYYMVSVRDNSV